MSKPNPAHIRKLSDKHGHFLYLSIRTAISRNGLCSLSFKGKTLEV